VAEPRAYEQEPRRTQLEATIVRSGVENDTPYVVLSDTILYPEGGGQPADRGTIRGVPVVDVRTQAGEVRHFLARPLSEGQVPVALDWAHRFDHMQQHTGQHLLTALAEDRFGWQTTAFHLGEDRSDIELDTPSIDDRRLLELEEAVADEVRANRAIRARRVSKEEYEALPVRSRGLPEGHTGSVRLVEIDGIDLNTCGGTHCDATGELETLKLLGTEAVRGGTRLFYVAGGRVRSLLGEHHQRNAELRSLLGVPDEELVMGMGQKLDQLKEAAKALRGTEEELAEALAVSLVANPTDLIDGHWPNRSLPFLQRLAQEVNRTGSDRVVFLTAGVGEAGSFLLAAGDEATLDVAAAGARVAEVLEGRGGGSGRIFQGRANALTGRQEALALLRELL